MNVIDIFEENIRVFNQLKECIISNLSKQQLPRRFDFPIDTEDVLECDYSTLKEELSIFQTNDRNTSRDIDESFLTKDLLNSEFYFKQCGIYLNENELVRLKLSKKLLPLTGRRFWGKIFGVKRNYYVFECDNIECEVTENDHDTAVEKDIENEIDLTNTKKTIADDGLPKSKWKPPKAIPPEKPGTGVNKHAYCICNHPGDPWIRLPDVKPEHIVAARQIRIFFTGILETDIHWCSYVLETEANYLRAQIARINSSTLISPESYYQLEEEYDDTDEPEESLLARDNCTENPDYNSLPIADLASTSLQHWVHHRPYILPQGRVSWKIQSSDDEAIDISDSESLPSGKEKAKIFGLQIEPERGPPVFTSIREDLAVYGQPPWCTRSFWMDMSEDATALLSSNLWPGAHAIAWERGCANVYIGWGLKANGPWFTPTQLPQPFSEYKDDEESQEMNDPTFDEEMSSQSKPK